MSMTASLNGHTEPVLEDPIERLEARMRAEADSLRDLLDDERREITRLQAVVDQHRDREKRLVRAIAQLTGATASTNTTPAKPKRANEWSVSEEKIAEVLQLIRDAGEPVTANALGRLPGTSTQSAKKAIDVLRERELIRFAGVVRGGGKTYLPMPSTSEPEDEAA